MWADLYRVFVDDNGKHVEYLLDPFRLVVSANTCFDLVRPCELAGTASPRSVFLAVLARKRCLRFRDLRVPTLRKAAPTGFGCSAQTR